MKNFYLTLFVSIIFISIASGQNSFPASGDAKLAGSKVIEFGFGNTKQVDAGKIGYQKFSSGLDIVGAGTTAANRRISFFAEGGAQFTGGLDIGLPRNSGSSLGGLTVFEPSAGYYTTTQLAMSGFGGSHALLFNAYKSATQVNGDLTAISNVKYANDAGLYGYGAGMIHFLGNGGRMDFYVSPSSTGINTNVNWQSTPVMSLNRNGVVMIGTWNPGSYKLAVTGKIEATGEVRVFTDGTLNFPDYVFAPEYKLRTLEETEQYVKENHHLPEVPSAAEIAKEGMSLNGMSEILLKKIEEMTLYLIEMKKENEELKKRLEILESKR
jgi:hypothetical protein